MSIEPYFWRPVGRTERLLNVILRLTKPYLDEGVDLTPAQVFGLLLDDELGLVEDTRRDYDILVELLNKAHLAGRLDWSIGKDRAFDFFGPHGGVEVWVFRPELALVTLAAAAGVQAGVLSTRPSPSNSTLHQAIERGPKVILILGPEIELERRLARLGYDGDVFSIDWHEGAERLEPEAFISAMRDELAAFDLPAETEPEPDETPAVDQLIYEIGTAMASVGDTTRAIALKRKLIEIIGGA